MGKLFDVRFFRDQVRLGHECHVARAVELVRFAQIVKNVDKSVTLGVFVFDFCHDFVPDTTYR